MKTAEMRGILHREHIHKVKKFLRSRLMIQAKNFKAVLTLIEQGRLVEIECKRNGPQHQKVTHNAKKHASTVGH